MVEELIIAVALLGTLVLATRPLPAALGRRLPKWIHSRKSGDRTSAACNRSASRISFGLSQARLGAVAVLLFVGARICATVGAVDWAPRLALFAFVAAVGFALHPWIAAPCSNIQLESQPPPSSEGSHPPGSQQS